jgi:NAD(P)-dependent dehydrogenase (short-subunit alcohol dehydrogenase family)
MGLQRGEQADGQVNLALVGARYLRDGGSITLTSGVLLDQPVRSGAAASLANGGVEAFVRAAAIELPRGLRINAIRPGVVEESMDDYASMCFAASNRCRSHASRWPTAARSRR